MAACQEFACLELGCPRTEIEICKIFNLGEIYSSGINALNALADKELIKLPDIRESRTDLFLVRYLETLGIPKKYKSFIQRILANAEVGPDISDFKLTSKIAGILLILIQKLGINAKIDEIENLCEVKRDTFSQFAEFVLCSYKFHKIFEAFNFEQ
jgi:transcription initiation factor TFIIIB Brf1 subunit/transcription initiation factor TFIIB